MSTAAIVVLVVVLLAVLFAAGWFLGGQARSRRLRNRFGPEYDRHLENTQNRRVAERELAEREKRHAKLSLRPLSDTARVRYTEQWTRVQEHFVDEPVEAVAAAEDLVHTVMRDRGYPMDGFEQQAADLSVEHADVVDGYRAAHEIRGRAANTEELRTALVHYRELFRELIGHSDDVPAQRDGHTADRHDREAHHA